MITFCFTLYTMYITILLRHRIPMEYNQYPNPLSPAICSSADDDNDDNADHVDEFQMVTVCIPSEQLDQNQNESLKIVIRKFDFRFVLKDMHTRFMGHKPQINAPYSGTTNNNNNNNNNTPIDA